jgi:flagellar motor switch protein FliN/FliY
MSTAEGSAVLESSETDTVTEGLRPVQEFDVVARSAEFAELHAAPAGSAVSSLNSLLDVTVEVTAELGRTTISIEDVLKLNAGSVLELNRLVSEPVDLMVQGVLLARGEVVVVEDRFAIRIKEIPDAKKKESGARK